MGKIYPPFANDLDLLKESWDRLNKLDSLYYYPAHGKRISSDAFKHQMLKKYKL